MGRIDWDQFQDGDEVAITIVGTWRLTSGGGAFYTKNGYGYSQDAKLLDAVDAYRIEPDYLPGEIVRGGPLGPRETRPLGISNDSGRQMTAPWWVPLTPEEEAIPAQWPTDVETRILIAVLNATAEQQEYISDLEAVVSVAVKFADGDASNQELLDAVMEFAENNVDVL